VEITLHEGRQRQVRRMFDAVGHPVVRLRRVRIGPIEDRELPPGRARPLTPQEVEKLRRAARSGQR
jgi:pseudouridine synthase